MAKLQWFPFFPSDWLGSTKLALMTTEQEGIFLRLLAHSWNDPDCSIPDDLAKIALLAKFPGPDQTVSEVVSACFVPVEGKSGRLHNSRLSEIHREQRESYLRLAAAGRKGGLSEAKARLKHPEPEPEPDRREEKSQTSASADASGVRLMTLRIVGLWNEGREDVHRVRITPRRLQRVRARLRDGFNSDQLLNVVAKLKVSPFHNGDNDRGWRAPGPEWVLHSTERVEQFLTGEPGRRIVRDAPARTCPNCGGGGVTPAGPCPGCPEGRAKRRAL